MTCRYCDGRGCLACPQGILPAVPTDTQIAAVASLDPVRLRQQTAAILETVILGDGATDEAIYVALNEHGIPISVNGHRARRRELELAGYVRRSERRSETSTGRQAIVWVATEAGRRALRAWQTVAA